MWTTQDAKNRFSAVVDAALTVGPQEVSRRGRPAVVVVAAEEFARLKAEALRPRKSFEEHLLSYRPGPDGDQDFVIERLPLRMRDVEF